MPLHWPDPGAYLCAIRSDLFPFGLREIAAPSGFEYRKPKALPRVADEVKQADFIDFYESLLNTLPADEAVYFADAVNREYQSKPAFGWVKKGSNPAVKTTQGRGRVNIHGALCLENFDAPFIEPVTVNGNSAVQLLAKIEANNPTRSTIHVIWDNAAYHRCGAVKQWIARPECRIHLIKLPAYCPHWNLTSASGPSCTHTSPFTHTSPITASIQPKSTSPKPYRASSAKPSRNFRNWGTDNFRII